MAESDFAGEFPSLSGTTTSSQPQTGSSSGTTQPPLTQALLSSPTPSSSTSTSSTSTGSYGPTLGGLTWDPATSLYEPTGTSSASQALTPTPSPTGTSGISSVAPQTPAPAPTATPAPTSNVIDKLLQQYNQSIPLFNQGIPDLQNWEANTNNVFESQPFTTSQEQAMKAQAIAGINTNYDTAIQNLKNQLGPMQGNSGILNDEIAKLETARAQDISNVDRQIMSQASQTYRSGLTTGLQNQLALQAAQRAGPQLSLQDLTDLANLDTSRNQYALADELALYGLQGNNLNALLNLTGSGASSANDLSTMAGNILSGATGLANSAENQIAANNAGLSAYANYLVPQNSYSPTVSPFATTNDLGIPNIYSTVGGVGSPDALTGLIQ